MAPHMWANEVKNELTPEDCCSSLPFPISTIARFLSTVPIFLTRAWEARAPLRMARGVDLAPTGRLMAVVTY